MREWFTDDPGIDRGTVASSGPVAFGINQPTKMSLINRRIEFTSMLSHSCEDFGTPTQKLIRLANSHPRVNIIQSGQRELRHSVGANLLCISHSTMEIRRQIDERGVLGSARTP